MKNIYLGTLVFGMLLLSGGINPVKSEEGRIISVSEDFAINSKYVWRGFLLDDDPVLQSGISLGAGGFSGSIWGSFDIDNEDALTASEEVDYVLSYSFSLKNLTFSLGHTYYDFPTAKIRSKEWFVGTEIDTLFSPSVTVYRDYEDEIDGGGFGTYTSLGLSHSLPLNKYVTLDLSGSYGINHELFILGDGSDALFGASVSVVPGEGVTITPGIYYSVPFGDLKDSLDGNQDSEFYSGVTVSLSF